LLHLLALLAQRIEVDRLRELLAVVLAQGDFLGPFGLELLGRAGQPGEPEGRHDADRDGQADQQLGNEGPGGRIVGIEAPELRDDPFLEGGGVERGYGGGHGFRPLVAVGGKRRRITSWPKRE
jgi:hypothetical protein